MTRSIIRRVDWTCAHEPSSPDPIHVFACTKCGAEGTASNDFEQARGWTFTHVGQNPSHTGFAETVVRYWRMSGDGVDEPPERPTDADMADVVRLSYTVEPPNCQACHDVGGDCVVCACPNCGGRGSHVQPNASMETECWRCEGRGRIRPLTGSRPTLQYGAPFVPVYAPATNDEETTGA